MITTVNAWPRLHKKSRDYALGSFVTYKYANMAKTSFTSVGSEADSWSRENRLD
jgi:hypothetical protein